jgi:hypothetical protein
LQQHRFYRATNMQDKNGKSEQVATSSELFALPSESNGISSQIQVLSSPRFLSTHCHFPCFLPGFSVDIFVCFPPTGLKEFIQVLSREAQLFVANRGVGSFETKAFLIYSKTPCSLLAPFMTFDRDIYPVRTLHTYSITTSQGKTCCAAPSNLRSVGPESSGNLLPYPPVVRFQVCRQ